MKKYFYRVYDQNGQIVFDHTSDYAYRLLKLYDKESRDSSGAIYCAFYFGRIEHNIPGKIIDRVACGEKV